MFWLPRGRILWVWVPGIVLLAAWFPIVKAATHPHTAERTALLVTGMVLLIALIATVVGMAIRGSD